MVMPAVAVAIGGMVTVLAVAVTTVVAPPQRSNDAAAQRRTNDHGHRDSGKMTNEAHGDLLGDRSATCITNALLVLLLTAMVARDVKLR